MEAGKMRHKITIKTPPDPTNPANQSPSGEVSAVWIDFATMRASIEPLIGNEFYKALELQTQVEVKFRIRYIPGVENKMRVYHGTVGYEILSAINVEERNIELLLYCKKVV